ncbi:putative zinc-finger of transcription factor IIIC complex-domain-containing protein [Gaertneriomyces semiglobifer]|nr:putative zinc-finger of transcription factor IIIC complex-domain-containing protein [Gaertneriomyces semiglobifer]
MAGHITRLATRPTFPNSVEWSRNNQIAVVTWNAIYIITQQWNNGTKETWRTSIIAHKRETELDVDTDEHIKASDVLRDGFRCAAWSPIMWSSANGCLLATVNMLHTVSVWRSAGDPRTSNWMRIQVLSEPTHTQGGPLAISIAWSCLAQGHPLQQPFSLIAVGAKDGRIHLWRHSEDLAEHCGQIVAHETAFVTMLSWSTWRATSGTSAFCYLASSGSNGSVKIWKIAASTVEPVPPELSCHAIVVNHSSRAANLLKFHHNMTDSRARLAICVNNVITVWLEGDADADQSGALLEFTLPITSGVGGLIWGSGGDEIRVYTVDGQGFILALQEGPSGAVIELIEDFTLNIRKDVLSSPDALTIGGDEDDEESSDMETSDESANQLQFFGADTSANACFDAFCLVYKLPSTMTYRTDKNSLSFLAIRPMFSENEEFDAELIQRIETILPRTDLGLQWTSLNLINDVVQYCINDLTQWNEVEDTFFYRLMKTIYMANVKSGDTILSTYEDVHETNSLFPTFIANLFNNRHDFSQRLSNFVCVHLKAANREDVQAYAKSLLANNLKQSLYAYVVQCIRLVDRFLDLTHEPLSNNDMLFMAHLTDVCVAHSADIPDRGFMSLLQSIHQKLERRDAERYETWSLRPSFPSDQTRTGEAPLLPAREKCPACADPIRISSPWKAVCPNGHMWHRCSATFSIICSPAVLTCLGCNRKVLQADSSGITSEISRRITRCIYCGCCLYNPTGLLEPV